MLNEVTLDFVETNRAGLLTIDLVEMLCNEPQTSGDRLLPSQQSGVAHVGSVEICFSLRSTCARSATPSVGGAVDGLRAACGDEASIDN